VTNQEKIVFGMKAPPTWRAKLLGAYLANNSITIAQASRTCNTPASTVRLWLGKFKRGDHCLEDAPRSGRPKLLDSKAKKAIICHLSRSKHATIASATARVQKFIRVSSKTVQREVRNRSKKQLLWGHIPTAPISPANVKRRVEATTLAQIRLTKGRLNKLVFLDGANIWWKAGKIKGFKVERRYLESGATAPASFGWHKIHFYAAITLGLDGKGYLSDLIFVPPTPGQEPSFTAEIFRCKVARPLLEWGKQLYEGSDFFFVQDNAKQHNAIACQKWMVDEGYILHDHPPQSPDLNRIEKVWAVFKKDMSKRRPRSLHSLFTTMQKRWRTMDPRVVCHFINDLPEVMARVHARPERHDNM